MDTVLRAGGWDQLSLGIASLDEQLASRDSTWTDYEGKIHTLSLRLANLAFVQRGLPIQPAYLASMGRTFGAGIALVDFKADTKGAIDAINGWVSRQTVGRIPMIVDSSTIKDSTRLALVNAVYLKANWAREFSPSQTTTETSATLGGRTVRVPMMHQDGQQAIGLASGPGWKATELYYLGAGGQPLAMTLVLPDDLRVFERNLSPQVLATVQARIAAQERLLQKVSYNGQPNTMDCGTYAYQIRLGLPRFGVDTAAKLKDLLSAMGMSLAMTRGAADFTGINPDEPLFIGQVVHKANVDVDEKGTTAAAATVVGVDTGGCTGPNPAKTVKFTLNRPFLFLIRDVKTGAILFLGRVTDPSQR
jgi:serpin B